MMHHALEIQEVLFNIFRHFTPRRESSNLVALAGTCRTFKEPALDLLWEVLDDLSPLARCLPKACRLLLSNEEKRLECYYFRRSLTQVEWDTLRSYTHRVRSITILDFCGLSRRSIRTLSTSSATQQLFPNLRYLHLEYDPVALRLFLQPLPLLVSLNVVFGSSRSFPTPLKSLGTISPDLLSLSVKLPADDVRFNETNHNYICQWRNLHRILCPEILLDAATLVHLSCMPALRRLSFKLNDAILDQIAHPDSPLVFSRLRRLGLNAQSLTSVTRLLSHICLPSITHYHIEVERSPSWPDLCSFFSSMKTSSSGPTIQALRLTYQTSAVDLQMNSGFEYLQPCTTFTDLRRIKLNVGEQEIDFTDGELLTMASALPRLEHLLINEEWGWETKGGITPNGLLQLLKTCRSLTRIALAVDTQGVADVPLPVARSEWTLPPFLFVNVLDSRIETESVLGVAVFFSRIASRTELTLCAWKNSKMCRSGDWAGYKSRWDKIKRRVKGVVRQGS